MTPENFKKALDKILPTVEKPARYIGGEFNQIVKDWSKTPLRIALGFPDIYDIGMSNLGLAILYDIVNKQDDMLAERVFLPWLDMEKAMRTAKIPLYSLESKHLIKNFDILGISLPYEILYTNMLCMLDLAQIPIMTAHRGKEDPIVICGGHACFNPEPVAEFADAFLIGEGEQAILEIAHCISEWKKSKASRKDLHFSLTKIEGVYVPSLYSVKYHNDGTIKNITPLASQVPSKVRKRIVAKLPLPLTHFIVPNLSIVHNRAAIEIMRGCTRGCRFCHAGFVTRPVRERPVLEIIEAVKKALDCTGFEEVGLLSLSSSDYSHILPLIQTLTEQTDDRVINISLPSLRIESLSPELIELMQKKSRRSGITLAPEAASEKMREIINKPASTQAVLDAAHEIYKRGWPTVKTYFMIGHPLETLDDVKAIADLCKAILKEGKKILGRRAQTNVGVSTFVPKTHTPFQWAQCDTKEQIEAKQNLLKQQVRGPGLKLNWTNVHETLLEAWLSRGDRRLGAVIFDAWKNGAKFDAWQEHFKYDVWETAFKNNGLESVFYTHRPRSFDETLPWDHIDSAVDKSFLWEDYKWSIEGKIRPDCREHCFACGILHGFKKMRQQNPGNVWKCPEVGKSEK